MPNNYTNQDKLNITVHGGNFYYNDTIITNKLTPYQSYNQHDRSSDPKLAKLPENSLQEFKLVLVHGKNILSSRADSCQKLLDEISQEQSESIKSLSIKIIPSQRKNNNVLSWDLKNFKNLQPIELNLECYAQGYENFLSNFTHLDISKLTKLSMVNINGQLTKEAISLIPPNIEILQLFSSELSEDSRELLIEKLQNCRNINELVVSQRSQFQDASFVVKDCDELLQTIITTLPKMSIKTLTLEVNIDPNTIQSLVEKAPKEEFKIALELSSAKISPEELAKIVDIVIEHKDIFSLKSLNKLHLSDSQLAKLYQAFPESRQEIELNVYAGLEVLQAIVEQSNAQAIVEQSNAQAIKELNWSLAKKSAEEKTKIVDIVIEHKNILSFDAYRILCLSDDELAKLYKAFPQARKHILENQDVGPKLVDLAIRYAEGGELILHSRFFTIPGMQNMIKEKLPLSNIKALNIDGTREQILDIIKHLPQTLRAIDIYIYENFCYANEQEKDAFINDIYEDLKFLPYLTSCSVVDMLNTKFNMSSIDKLLSENQIQEIPNLVNKIIDYYNKTVLANNNKRQKLEEEKIQSSAESGQIQERKNISGTELFEQVYEQDYHPNILDPEMGDVENDIIGQQSKTPFI